MANVYRTAKGKMVDVGKLKLANESTVAVGNMKVNARGDLLGNGGKVVAGRNQVMDQIYAVNSNTGYSPNDPANYVPPVMEMISPKELTDLANNSIVTTSPSVDDNTPSPVPLARGSLADSIAKQTTVTQEALPTPQEQRKSNGPSRI
jgi:hypothetical protein